MMRRFWHRVSLWDDNRFAAESFQDLKDCGAIRFFFIGRIKHCRHFTNRCIGQLSEK